MKTLYAKLASMSIASFVVIGGGFVIFWVMTKAPDGREVGEIVAGLVLVMIALLLVMAVAMHALVTRRVNALARAMRGFQGGGFKQTPILSHLFGTGEDELRELTQSFASLSAHMMEQLQQNEHQRRDLLTNLSHDLRTPLASIRGYLETILLKQCNLDATEMRNYLEVALRQCDRLNRMVTDLSQLTELEAHDVALQRETFSVAELAQDVAQKFALKVVAQGLRLETDIPKDLPLVSGDVGLLERCFDNLIENAVRHTPLGGVVRISLGRSGEPDGVTVRVSDSGAAIEPNDLTRIFDRFYQADCRLAPVGGGAGLGLAITKHIIELHGSRIDVESRVGKGSAFAFTLPAAGVDRRPLQRTPESAPVIDVQLARDRRKRYHQLARADTIHRPGDTTTTRKKNGEQPG